VPTELEHIWSQVQADLRRRLPPSTYRIWLEPLRARELTTEGLVIVAPPEICTWVADRFADLLEHCVAERLGSAVPVTVVSPDTPLDARHRPGAGPAGTHVPAPDLSFNPKLTFEQFVIGDCNRLAHGAALAVAEMPSQAYNPLFIYGPPGLGKTHLLHSIANYVGAHSTGLTLRYTTVESFTNEFLSALRSGSVERFKSRFRHNDVLLIDDVQFLERKARTEEEFFHTFNALHDMGGQLVLTSDRLPADLAALEDRLRERFEAGLVTSLSRPDAATRLTILRKRVAHDSISLEEGAALEVIAERVTASVRALEGALIRVVAFASLTRRSITAQLASEVLQGLYPAGRRRPPRRTVPDVQEAICAKFGISHDELVGLARSSRVAWPRQLAMYLSRELTDQSLPAIGRAFGGRDHTTVMYACRRTSERLSSDRDAFETVRVLTDQLSPVDG
jgi:chromosomal replication initiator protein